MALCHRLSSGCQWRDIPKDLPPRSTIHDYLFDRWSYDGTLDNVRHALAINAASKRDGGPAPLPR